MDNNLPLATIADFLVARAKSERTLVTELLTKARTEENYFLEKAIAKVDGFYALESALITQYIELKLYFPESARALEDQKPYLLTLWRRAEEDYALFTQNT